MGKSKLKIIKQDQTPTTISTLRGNDNEVIIDDQDDTIMDPYWSQAL